MAQHCEECGISLHDAGIDDSFEHCPRCKKLLCCYCLDDHLADQKCEDAE